MGKIKKPINISFMASKHFIFTAFQLEAVLAFLGKTLFWLTFLWQ